MKQLILSAMIVLLLSSTVFASSPALSKSQSVDWQKAEKNYLVALTSENIGVRQSAAYYLAEYRLHGAVQPLIQILRTDKVEQLRMAAALALVTLGNNEGLEAVKEAVLYDGSEKVSKYCEQLINSTNQTMSLK